MEVKCDKTNYEYYIEEKYDGQTYRMSFYYDYTREPIQWYSIYLRIFSKRKHELTFENNIQETGKHPFFTYAWTKKAFEALQDYVLNKTPKQYKKIGIICFWLDNRRRDAYYKFLSRYGYYYAIRDNHKCLMKVFNNE